MNNNAITTLKQKFNEIKKRGFIETQRKNNESGGIGNTLEDLLGIKENNLNEADFKGIEIKSHRYLNSSVISLFTVAPSQPKSANAILREKYGEVRDTSGIKMLYASIFGNRQSLVYNKYDMKLNVDRTSKKVYLEITDISNNTIDNTTYWDFDKLMQYSNKISKLLLFTAKTKKCDNKEFFYYENATFYYNFNFDYFLKAIEEGKIQFDIRIGYYSSGKNIGKTHDHGNGFRISKYKFNSLFDTVEEF
ncbi:MAG: MvaI/BcnI family restriction endonuclease [Bacteroidales bacterium]|jgi:hypothetical protein|nr:MvaI/BcnI family restriction endonuclease [Bacteroidales bacterium]